MSIEESRIWKLYVYFWHTRLNTLRTFSCCAVIMNALQLIGYTASMKNVSGDPR